MINKKCSVCESMLTKTNAIYCSNACKQFAYRSRNRIAREKSGYCAFCSKQTEIYYIGKILKKKKYCSDACKTAFSRAKARLKEKGQLSIFE